MNARHSGQSPGKIEEAQIAALLEQRFGNSLSYISRKNPDSLLHMAREYGFIDAEGYLTRKGRALLARHH